MFFWALLCGIASCVWLVLRVRAGRGGRFSSAMRARRWADGAERVLRIAETLRNVRGNFTAQVPTRYVFLIRQITTQWRKGWRGPVVQTFFRGRDGRVSTFYRLFLFSGRKFLWVDFGDTFLLAA